MRFDIFQSLVPTHVLNELFGDAYRSALGMVDNALYLEPFAPPFKIVKTLNGGLLVKLKDGQKVEVSRRQAIKFKDKLSL